MLFVSGFSISIVANSCVTIREDLRRMASEVKKEIQKNSKIKSSSTRQVEIEWRPIRYVNIDTALTKVESRPFRHRTDLFSGHNPVAFEDGIKLVHGKVAHGIDGSGGPAHFHPINFLCRA